MRRPKKKGTFLQKLRHFPSEITATSSRNHGNFFKKSRQLLEEITAIIEGNLRDF